MSLTDCLGNPQNRIFRGHKIKCIDFLLLSILENPGKQQRFHTRRLYQWQWNLEDPHYGGTNIAFFTSESYRDVLFADVSPQTVEYYNHWSGPKLKSSWSQMHLTISGFDRANKLRTKLGLPQIDWDSAGHPMTCKINQPVV